MPVPARWKGFPAAAHQGSVIRNGKIRRNIQSRKVLLHKMQAERIHRADGRTLQQQLLAAQMQIAGVGADLLRQAGRDVGAQLGRGGIREGHNEQLVRVHRVDRVGDKPTTRSTSTRVLPEPQPPRPADCPPRAEMAAACAGVN